MKHCPECNRNYADPTLSLAGIILVLQLVVIAIIAASTLPNEARTADVPNMVAMGKAQTPIWAVAIQTLFSITGALVGRGLRKS